MGLSKSSFGNWFGGIILTILLVCTMFLIYDIVTAPLGEHNMMLALAITAGFVALGQKRKDKFQIDMYVGNSDNYLLPYFLF